MSSIPVTQVRSLTAFVLIVTALFVTTTSHADFMGTVVKVVDGDTVNVLEGKTYHKVRLSGIDAPERGQPYGSASRRHLAKLVDGETIYVESNRQDRYGRDLGKILLNDTDINLEQVKAGMAWWYEYYKDQQPREDQRLYEEAHENAKEAGLGLWADPNPFNPYRWRKKH